jgi:hypothetical protein
MPNGPDDIRQANDDDIRRFKTILIDLLNSASVQKIRFSAEAVTITPEGYRDVASKIRSGRLSIKFGPVPTGGAASYDPTNNQIFVGPDPDLEPDPSVMIHELTHAVIDNMNFATSRPHIGLHVTEDEAIAYIAEQLFRRNRSLPRNRGKTQADARILQIAFEIAVHISLVFPKSYTVTQDEIRWLRDAVGHSPDYKDQRGKLTQSDGI